MYWFWLVCVCVSVWVPKTDNFITTSHFAFTWGFFWTNSGMSGCLSRAFCPSLSHNFSSIDLDLDLKPQAIQPRSRSTLMQKNQGQKQMGSNIPYGHLLAATFDDFGCMSRSFIDCKFFCTAKHVMWSLCPSRASCLCIFWQ